MKIWKGTLILFLLLFVLWLLLAGTDPQELIVGGITALLLSLQFSSKAKIFAEVNISFRSFYFLILYIFIFLIALIKSNLDVARRVLDPKLPINPGIVKVKTKLSSKLGRIMLANSITLTPGTLTVETKDENYYIHWIDVTSPDINSATEAIVRKFEKYLEVIFG